MISRPGFLVTEKQVLFRIDGKLLDALDKKLAKEGYTTRNAWFKDAVSSYAGRGGGKAKKARR
jgi:metal-responsive CopG/Arc/MetJ family transcriptional regulator